MQGVLQLFFLPATRHKQGKRGAGGGQRRVEKERRSIRLIRDVKVNRKMELLQARVSTEVTHRVTQ